MQIFEKDRKKTIVMISCEVDIELMECKHWVPADTRLSKELEEENTIDTNLANYTENKFSQASNIFLWDYGSIDEENCINPVFPLRFSTLNDIKLDDVKLMWHIKIYQGITPIDLKLKTSIPQNIVIK